MIFDTWGGLLSAAAYRRVLARVDARGRCSAAPAADGRAVPTIVFTKGGGQWLDEIAASRRDGGRASTGPSTSPTRARASAAAWRCRATSTRWCC